MKKILLLVLVFNLAAFGQNNKKYQSLFWEISGKGLTKKSYLYGTMHVSDKVSYHLSDAFFEKLLATDYVANESEPDTWMDLYDLMRGRNDNWEYPKFYTNFQIESLKKKNLYPLFVSANYNLINLLSRTNTYNQDYQEETYLDMFIYRTGLKYGKKTVGLENVKETTINITKAQAEVDYTEIDQNRQALMKLLKNRNYNEVLMDAYREKDLDLIDTINVLASPKKFNKAMLLDRNYIMAKSMDSIMKKGSLFSAIGAAHLPGKQGVIEILRKQGYTVTPIFDKYTEKGKKTKKTIEELFVKPTFKVKSTPDEMVTLPLFPLSYFSNQDIESADLINGGAISVKRMSKLDFLSKKENEFKHETLDSLFFERIPGEILSKQNYKEKENYVYDIKSKTKTGKSQRFRYYITPLEIIAIIMTGDGDYVRKFEDEVFKNIKIKPYKSGFENFTTQNKMVNVKVPAYYKFEGNNKDKNTAEDMSLLGYEEEATYFLTEKSMFDVNNLEDTEFELKRMHYEFYQKLKADTINTEFNKNKVEFISKNKINNKNIVLKSVIKANKYYLLGTVNASENKTNEFFNSLQLNNTNNPVEYRVYKDSASLFSVKIPKKENEYLNFRFDRKENYRGIKNKNHFDAKSKVTEIYSPQNKKVVINYYGPHRYESQKAIDSMYVKFRKNLATDFESEEDIDLDHEFHGDVDSVAVEVVPAVSNTTANKTILNDNEDKFLPLNYESSTWNQMIGNKKKQKLELTNEKITQDTKQDFYTFEVLATKPKSNQALKIKTIVNKGEVYVLRTLVDKDYKNNDEFVEQVFNSFQAEKTNSRTFFENKFNFFIEDLNSEHDSIRKSAIQSFEELEIAEADLSNITNLIEKHTFKNDEKDLLVKLYEKLGVLKSDKVIPYLTEAYKKPNVTTDIQFAILNALTYQESTLAYEKIAELFEFDLPISDDVYEVTSLFSKFYKTKFSKVLYPGVLAYYSIPEYNEPIISFIDQLIEDKQINVKKLKPNLKMLLTNAKLEYKRLLSWKNKQDNETIENYDYEESDEYAPVYKLNNYITLLKPFENDGKVVELFEKIDQLNIPALNIAFADRELKTNGKLKPETIDKLVSDKKSKYLAYQMLYHNNQKEVLQKISKDSIVKTAIEFFDKIDKKNDSIEMLQPRVVDFKNQKVTFYFYKKTVIKNDAYNKNEQTIQGIAFFNEGEHLNLKAFKELKGVKFTDEAELENQIKSIIDTAFNSKHIRANFNNNNNFYNDLDYGEDY